MKTTFRVLLTLAGVALAAGAAAQTPGVLNTLAVQRLVDRDTPENHAELSVHFAALGAMFEAETARYDSFARGFAGNPNRRFTTDGGATWARHASRTRQWAETVRELSEHHARLAFGRPSAAPEGTGAFHGGRGATEPTRADLRALAASARTPSDHRVLAEYYLTLADRHQTSVARHRAMAGGFRGTPRRTGSGDAAVHCDRVITEASRAAEDALVRAQLHRQLADIAG